MRLHVIILARNIWMMKFLRSTYKTFLWRRNYKVEPYLAKIKNIFTQFELHHFICRWIRLIWAKKLVLYSVVSETFSCPVSGDIYVPLHPAQCLSQPPNNTRSFILIGRNFHQWHYSTELGECLQPSDIKAPLLTNSRAALLTVPRHVRDAHLVPCWIRVGGTCCKHSGLVLRAVWLRRSCFDQAEQSNWLHNCRMTVSHDT